MTNPVITRDDAYAKGLPRFYTGRPCKRGHLAERFVVNGACTSCVNFKRIPALSAPNYAVPPSGYIFPRGVIITPQLISAVHAKVLARIHDLVNEVERDTGESAMREGTYFMTSNAGTSTRLDFIRQGWTDAQLLAEGLMARV